MQPKQKDSFYYFMRDILTSLSGRFEENFLETVSRHFIAKDSIKEIFLEEVEKKKPSFAILYGCLMVQNALLRRATQIAFYEPIEVLEALYYCLHKDKRKTIRRLASDAI